MTAKLFFSACSGVSETPFVYKVAIVEEVAHLLEEIALVPLQRAPCFEPSSVTHPASILDKALSKGECLLVYPEKLQDTIWSSY